MMPITTSAPMRPSSSPITAKIKSFSTSGIQDHFIFELPSPTPIIPPAASAQVPCSYCQLNASEEAEPGLSQAVIRAIRDALLVVAKAAKTATPANT